MVVTGVPFSAKASTESSQTLADGNRIIHSTSVLIARDGLGRTRREQTLAGSETPVVIIQDSVAGLLYVLDSRSMSVHTSPLQVGGKPGGPQSGTSVSAESLGTQALEGFIVEGTRLTLTIPPAKDGNDKPITVTTETWYSPKLQIVLMKKTLDPRLGEVDYKVTNIQLGEPTSSLFQVPSTYILRSTLPMWRP